ncbi:hypothetical protein HYH03_019124 [Edaphochlamys debaryana]|uniref:Uncharacterized protein n=1 Tax=Edaphochlamys debaryana TaxID=47281 RepID=A0A836BMH0_9CHLO|nr:hypothetical protein HYH03_019124 [Edaphochlamys debaryana]|eukprot:KAG2481915.1 hypothetical protein HYH03_019124 [Edaphochlamys debaryana]
MPACCVDRSCANNTACGPVCYTWSGNCPVGTCCTAGQYSQGSCSPSPFVGGVQVCRPCSSFLGLACPANATLCCLDGTCAPSLSRCPCAFTSHCPRGYCCTAPPPLYPGAPNPTLGACVTSVLSGNAQVCPDCRAFAANGLSCPAGRPVCCGGTGACVEAPERCACSQNTDCPVGSCCPAIPGTRSNCTRALVNANGAQACPGCLDFPNQRMTCPSGLPVCCPNGKCATAPDRCDCTSDYECPAGTCCTGGSALNWFGTCTRVGVLTNGSQVCGNCVTFRARGFNCPTNKPVCCPDGSCVAAREQCQCARDSDCPLKTCCAGASWSSKGNCTAQVLGPNGAQACGDCRFLASQGLGCPSTLPVCCGNGKCAASAAGCSCYSDNDCPTGTCCSGSYSSPGTCTSRVVLANGTQACANCLALPNQGMGCPSSRPFCCPGGACATSPGACTCTYNAQCPFGTCCTSKDYSVKGVCVGSVAWPNGTQTCADCLGMEANGLVCPADKSVCCAKTGRCAKSGQECPCTADYECLRGMCCSGDYLKPGLCTPSVLRTDGSQQCADCRAFASQGLACPSTKSVCCPSGKCAASAAQCPCAQEADCPMGSCCTGTFNKPGNCSRAVLLGSGAQACASCVTMAFQGLACPATRPFCCPGGACATSATNCTCRANEDCPYGTCCTGSFASPGVCSRNPLQCPCKGLELRGLACPTARPVCCPYTSKCAASASLCPCPADTDCPPGACCNRSLTNPNLGNCSRTGVAADGSYLCAYNTPVCGVACLRNGTVCCPDGRCAASADRCTCTSDDQCLQGMCCAGATYFSQGVCSRSIVAANGTQVCANCTRANARGLACPANKTYCCPSGACAASLEACACKAEWDCPFGSCCVGASFVASGTCSRVVVLANRTQACADCNAFAAIGMACPSTRPFCCTSGQCATALSNCTCQGDDQCPPKTCCTGNYSSPGVCSASVMRTDGSQACYSCLTLGAKGLSCPTTKPLCCWDGKCASSAEQCTCSDNIDCPMGTCCTGNYTLRGSCTRGVMLSTGQQACPDCFTLSQRNLSCPTTRPICCRTGACVTSSDRCSCTIDADCPTGMCCAGSRAKPGFCTRTATSANGTQLCASCQNFIARNMTCPAGRPLCCRSGLCASSVDKCPCAGEYECPVGSCCTSTPTRAGNCSLSVTLSNGTQACANCVALESKGMACPSTKRICCPGGMCAATIEACKCSSDSDCPAGSCCTGTASRPGVCSRTAVNVTTGLQLCANCTTFSQRAMGCSSLAPVCCMNGRASGLTCTTPRSVCCPNTGRCAATSANCTACQGNADCAPGSCCTGNATRPGVCILSTSANATTLCPDCRGSTVTCRSPAPVCCPATGTCATSLALCPCATTLDCPFGGCCSAEVRGEPGRLPLHRFCRLPGWPLLYWHPDGSRRLQP